MFFVLFISHLHWLWEENKRVLLDVNSFMVWFSVLPYNYSNKVLSFTWHFVAVAANEIAVLSFCMLLFNIYHRQPLHCIAMLNIFSSASWNPYSMLSKKLFCLFKLDFSVTMSYLFTCFLVQFQVMNLYAEVWF